MEEDLGGAYSAPGALGNGEGSSCLAPGSTHGVVISYQLYGIGATKLLLIPGLACGHGFWGPYVRELTSSASNSGTPSEVEEESNKFCSSFENDGGVQICTFDNRGVGNSSIPTQKSEYSTTIMAMDALSLLDFLGWKQAHICGHSMGAMIGFKLAAMAPQRVLSLTLISITGGGFQCFPKMEWRSLSIAYRFLTAKTLEQRILVDLDTHYTRDYLNEITGGVQRKNILYKEYLKNMETGGMQPKAGLNGHIHACWSHEAKDSDIQQIRAAGFPVAVIHGIDDVIAQIRYGKRLAQRLGSSARFWVLSGGHLVTHQNTKEVAKILAEVIHTTSLQSSDWSRSNTKTESEEGRKSQSFWKRVQRLLCGCFCVVAVTSWLLVTFAL
ncbi:uncharacterized protein LOC9644258 isoform X2 [Selaginella moellendorffii]|uniref:uncharacterized protein LOC9644258 isoform X2 n=1 Tax=Selaginella moellendorffii TaxID=88036 RepID=UPI000D1CF1F8|nr:uncharacterized protein LOC9644258 isoform X2 [Selaginella moellendorffii]|eukprot:XP_024545183.1 uncharacterized protein LOC9644258 isoform X2 [Selaginella moellendorffii]